MERGGIMRGAIIIQTGLIEYLWMFDIRTNSSSVCYQIAGSPWRFNWDIDNRPTLKQLFKGV